MTYTCAVCGEEKTVTDRKVSRPRAVCVCLECARSRMSPEELDVLLHPERTS